MVADPKAGSCPFAVDNYFDCPCRLYNTSSTSRGMITLGALNPKSPLE